MAASTPETIARQLPPSLALVIETLPIAELATGSRQLRIRKKSVLEAMGASIRQFGFLVPALIDAENRIVCGKGRVEAARLIGMTEVPCIRITHLSEAEQRVFAIAENQLGQLAGWDPETLRIELKELSGLDLSFSLELTGFSAAKIDSIIFGGDNDGARQDAIPELTGEIVSQPGDLWLLGDNRLLCGDATAPESLATLLCGEQVRTIFTDPPYNVPIAGHVTGGGQHGEFVMASGEMSEAEFTAFLTRVMERCIETLVAGGLLFLCMDWRGIDNTTAAAKTAGLELLNLIVWDKQAGGMGSFYRSRHELIFLMRKPGASHRNRVELGRHGRDRANVWTYPGVNGFGAAKAKAREMHPTVKPLALVRDALLDCTAKGDPVLDLFSGSGTTLIAAEQCGRRGFATELDPRYVDTGVMRWEAFTGREARLAATGQTFREVRAAREAPVVRPTAMAVADPAPLAGVRVRTRPTALAA
ncbi:MAG: DNA methyltransferase [Brevundimonas sp.]|uniref:site-specific DNA-methyltransferase n=1 Tax=Brevundimonas sp. TaxID=1871086 RepID=UPI002736A030|nr:DNA methyltransferase [Brevundimonas sp.]MDP3405226.1 DNA methyltransferase [Brevundimonas sp.]